MCAFGNLWDSNHHFTPIKDVLTGQAKPIPWEAIQALREHYTTVHGKELRAHVRWREARNRAEMAQMDRQNAIFQYKFYKWVRQRAMWDTKLLKTLNQQGTLL